MLKRKSKYILLGLVIVGSLWHPSVKALELNKETIDVHKAWNISFNQSIDFNDEAKNSIRILDSKGNTITTNIRSGDSKTIIVDAPKEGYKEGETYTIDIGNNIHSKSNVYLKNSVKCIFKINNSDNKTGASDKYKDQVDNVINLGVNKILKDGVEDQWQAVAVSKHSDSVPSSYLTSVQNEINSTKGDKDQPIDYARTVIGLMAIEKDPTNFEGYNLIEKIYNNKQMESETINTYIFSLIALDSGKFDVPANALWTRDRLIKTILNNRTFDKGWDYAGDKADPDMTGMALTALAPYRDRDDVKLAVEEAIDKLSSMQNENGGFSSWGTENSESSCQVIIGLCANGIDPTGDKFVKNGKNPLDALLEYRTEDGGFSHTKETGCNGIATEQGVEALEAYKMFKQGKGSIYSFK